MRSVRVTTIALLFAVAALVGALVVGTSQARDKAERRDRANSEQELTSTFWPAGFKRVSASAASCSATPPSICLTTEASTKDAAADLATRLSAPNFAETPVAGAPSTYTVAGTLTRNGTAVTATITAHVDESASTSAKKAQKYAGSDVVVDLDGSN